MKEFLLCATFAVSGWFMTSLVIGPLIGGVRMRPIPYQITQAGDVLLDLTLSNEAIEDVTVPGPVLTTTCVWIPLILIFSMSFFCKLTSTSKSIDGVNCFLFALGMEQVISQTLKIYVGRLRPNFYSLCGFDKVTLQCTADIGHQIEARLSFPSGHSSLSFCGMTLLMWFSLGCWIKWCNRNGGDGTIYGAIRQNNGILGCLITLSPLLFATFVSTSRLADNWHHPSDVIAGIIIGITCATISYHLWFHSIFSNHAGVAIRLSNHKKMVEEEGSSV